MSRRHYSSSAAATTLTSSIGSSDTTIAVGSITGLPVQYPYALILDPDTASEEVVDVTAGGGTTLTVTRGVDGTTALAHTAGAVVQHGVSARDFDEPNAHIAASAAVHGLTGTVVGTSDTQALSNKDLSSGNTFPSTLLTTTGSQTVTNKDLSSATNTFPASRPRGVPTTQGHLEYPASYGPGAGPIALLNITPTLTSGRLYLVQAWGRVARTAAGDVSTFTLGRGAATDSENVYASAAGVEFPASLSMVLVGDGAATAITLDVSRNTGASNLSGSGTATNPAAKLVVTDIGV